jgi:hypothetical protein
LIRNELGAKFVSHVVLLGDSIFDNQRYVAPGHSVFEQLRSRLPAGWKATLLACDGAVTSDVEGQLAVLPDDASHLILSIGGNDALEQRSLLIDDEPGMIQLLGSIRAEFQERYRAVLQAVLKCGRPLAVCTVYDAIPGLDEHDRAGLCLFNDVILREAFRISIPVIDLRLACTSHEDYSSVSPIEPSFAGSIKIARSICRVLESCDFTSVGTRIFA